jgi:tetratricopeptide (TPR) repeat protein
LDDFNKVLETNPNLPEVLDARAVIYILLDRIEDALIEYDKILEMYPEYETAHFHKGVCLVNVNRYEEAKESFLTSIELNPLNIEPYVDYSKILIQEGEINKAISYLTKAINIEPNLTILYTLRERCYRMIKEDDIADKDKQMIIELSKKYDQYSQEQNEPK